MATTLVNFLSQHIHIPLSPSGRDQDHDYFVRTPQQQPPQQQQQLPHQSPDKPRVYSVFSELRTLEQQSHSALEQFPCEDRHSFNPHYQHNLLTSSANSTPPSLFSTSANSSASSYSSSSTFSLSRATGTRALGYESPQQPHTISSGAGGRQNYSSYHHYHHHQNPRRFARLQQQQDRGHDDWMFGISDDDDIRAASTSPSGPCMGRVHPQNAPICPPSLSSAASLRSSLVRRIRPQRGTVTSDTFLTESQIKKQRSMVTFSSVILQHPPSTEQPSTVLPSISESSHRSLASNSSAAVFEATPSGRVDCHQESSPARQSLMRIAQMSKDQDGWCSQNAGQYTLRYAEARPRGMMLDGRRSCRR